MLHVISLRQFSASLGSPVVPSEVLEFQMYDEDSSVHIHELEIANPEIRLDPFLPVDESRQKRELVRL
jgi:hypothetical protein